MSHDVHTDFLFPGPIILRFVSYVCGFQLGRLSIGGCFSQLLQNLYLPETVIKCSLDREQIIVPPENDTSVEM